MFSSTSSSSLSTSRASTRAVVAIWEGSPTVPERTPPWVGTVDVSAKDEGMKKVESQRRGISKDFDGRKNDFALVSKHNCHSWHRGQEMNSIPLLRII